MVKTYDGEAGTNEAHRDTFLFKTIEASQELLSASNRHKTARSRIRQTLRGVIVCWYDHVRRPSGDLTHHHSVAALGVRSSSNASAGCTYDHVIPVSLIVDEVLEREWGKASDIRAFLDRYYQTCWITIEEDAVLNSRGLRQAMPSGWSWQEGQIWSRYAVAGIEIAGEHP